MKKLILFIIVLLVLGVAMMATCPKERDHKDAVCLAVNQAIDEKLGNASGLIDGLISYGGKYALKKGAEVFINENIQVEDYIVLSLGRYTYGGRNSVISLGVLNHVFTVSKDDILREVEKRGF